MGGEGGVSDIFLRDESYSFGHLEPHAKFQNHSLSPYGLYFYKKKKKKEEKEILLIIKDSLATAEVSAGGCG